MLKEKIENGTDKPCITGNVLKDPEAKLNHGNYLIYRIRFTPLPILQHA